MANLLGPSRGAAHPPCLLPLPPPLQLPLGPLGHANLANTHRSCMLTCNAYRTVLCRSLKLQTAVSHFLHSALHIPCAPVS